MSGDAFVKLPGLGLNSQSLMLPHIRQPSRSGGAIPGRSPRAPFRTTTTARTTVVKRLTADSADHALLSAHEVHPPHTSRSADRSRYDGALVSMESALLPTHELVPAHEPESTMTDPRTRYMDLLRKVSGDSKRFRSSALFCEALLQQSCDPHADATRSHAASAVALRLPVDPVRAASACWALDLLSRNSACQESLTEIREVLFPCLFIDFDKGAAVAPAHVRARFSDNEIAENPYLATDFYFEHYDSSRLDIGQLKQQLDVLQRKLRTTSSSVTRVLQRGCQQSTRPFFTSWRLWCRQNRIDRFAKDLLRRHGHRDTRRYVLDGTLTRWRLSVEQNRCVNLKQRVHALEYQLENTKNQFQLQCFRSDKYLRLVEELREELSQTRDVRDDLQTQVRDLQRELQLFQDTSRDQLNRHVSVQMEELGRWRRFARRKVEADKARAELLAFVTSGEGLQADAEEAGDDAETGTDNMTAEIESQLLQWCSAVMRQSVVATVKQVTNWTTDWHSGEVLLLLMHHVFPGAIPLAPLQEASVAKRAEQIAEIGKKVGVAHLPQPSDLLEGAGDMMILVAAELYNRHAALCRVSEQAPEFEPIVHELVAPEDGRPPAFDAEMLPEMLADADKELRRLADCDSESVMKDKHVWRTQEVLNGYASYITRERLQGRTVVVVDKKDVARFCKFAKNRYTDTAARFKMPPVDHAGMWLAFDQQLDALKAVLQKNYQDLRRVFTFYCRGKSLMSEADFWRFVADVRALDRTVTRAHVDKIFAIANDDTPPVAKMGRSFDTGLSSDDEEGDADDGELEDEENSETELIPSEFVECLVRIAEKKFAGKMLHERFQQFMQMHVVPFACKSDTDKFKKEIHSAQTQTSVQKYQKDLVKVFNYYAKGNRTAGKKKSKTMVLGDFQHFLKEAVVMSQALDETAAASVFNTVSSSAEESNKEIDHREFLEAIVCMSVFKTPSPFIPLDKKVEVISSAVINNLRNKLKPAVVLMEYPVVTLKQA
jgi:hypothetical protein